MNPKKSEIKQIILRDLGTKFDDQKVALENSVQQIIGAKTALMKAVKNIQGLGKVADKECDDGKIPDLKTLELVKLYVTRAMDSLTLTAQGLGQSEIRANGRLEQAEAQIKYLEKLFLAEEKRLEAFQAALANGEVLEDGDNFVLAESPAAPDNITPIRPDGVRPGSSIAQQRKAEAAAEAAAEAGGEAEAKPPPSATKTKKRRGRKAKGDSVDVAPDAG